MKRILTLLCSLTTGISANTASAETPLNEIQLEGSSVFTYVNLQNDFHQLAEILNKAYREYLNQQPDMPPFPVDIPKIFERAGISDISGITLASHPLENGYFLNRSLLSLHSKQPNGLLKISNYENAPFLAAEKFSADVDFIFEANFSATNLLELVRNLTTDLMGPMGVGLVDMQLNAEIEGTGSTLRDLIQQLDSRVQFALQHARSELVYHEEADSFLPANPAPLFAAVFKDAGPLFHKLQPMLTSLGMAVTQSNDYEWLRLLIPNLPPEINIYAGRGLKSGDLIFSSSPENWETLTRSGAKLAQKPDFINLRQQLPQIASQYVYNSERFNTEQINELYKLNLGQWTGMLDLLLAEIHPYMRESFAISYLADNGILTASIAPFSYKHQVGLIGLLMPAGIFKGFNDAMQENALNEDGSPLK